MLVYKIQQLEARIHASEGVIRDNGKKASKELATLKMEIAKKDAKIKELQMGGGGRGHSSSYQGSTSRSNHPAALASSMAPPPGMGTRMLSLIHI